MYWRLTELIRSFFIENNLDEKNDDGNYWREIDEKDMLDCIEAFSGMIEPDELEEMVEDIADEVNAEYNGYCRGVPFPWADLD